MTLPVKIQIPFGHYEINGCCEVNHARVIMRCYKPISVTVEKFHTHKKSYDVTIKSINADKEFYLTLSKIEAKDMAERIIAMSDSMEENKDE